MTRWRPNKPEFEQKKKVEVQAPRPRFKGRRGRLVNYTENFDYRPPEEIVRGTIPRVGTGFLGGQSGALKTFAAIELMFCIATGHPFAGRRIRRVGGVLYFAFEGAGTMPARIKARRSRLNDPNGELPIVVMENFGPVFTPRDYDDFHEVAERVKDDFLGIGFPLRAIIVDTVAAAGMIAEDRENDPAAWQRVFDGLNPISRSLKAPIILIHHYGKDANAGLRGSSNARAGADFALAMTCDRDELTGETSSHKLALTKSRSAPEGPIGDVHPVEVQIGTDEDGEALTSLVLTFDKPNRNGEELPSMRTCHAMLEELRAAWQAGNPYSITPQSRRTGRYAPRALGQRFEVKEYKVQRLLESWTDNEIIRMDVFDARNKRSGINVIGGI